MQKKSKQGGVYRRILETSIAPVLIASSTLFAGSPAVRAQDAGALVDALVRKGVLTNQEAEDVRADLTRDLSQTSAGKIKLSNSVTELKLYGDFRYRYQLENREAQVPNSGHDFQQSRNRFRLRLNAEAKLGRDWFAGFSLGTAQAADGEDQTFENGFDDYNIYITRAYLGWQPNDWLTVTVGKQKNPFYTTDLIWDADITPNGFFETIALHNLPIFGGSGGPAGSAKDGKSVAGSKSVNPWEINLVAGQLFYDDNAEFNLDSDLSTDGWLFVEQVIATYRFNKNTSITLAPAIYSYTAADASGLTNAAAFSDAGIVGPTISTTTTTSTVNTIQDTVAANGLSTTRVTTPTRVTTVVTTQTNPDGTRTVLTTATTVRPGSPNTKLLTGVGGVPNQQTTTATTLASSTSATPAVPANGALSAVSGETRQLSILTAPGDISFKLGGLKAKFYWDFAYNFNGRERYEDIYQLNNPPVSQSHYKERAGLAWLAGLQLGELKKKGDWSFNLDYREVGIASIDPNLNDSTWALGRLNQRGFKINLGYQIADPVTFTATGYFSWDLDDNVVGGRATNAPNLADANAVQVLLLQLNVKF